MSSPAVAMPTGGAVSPNRLGFCQRCGDPVSGKIRCSKCSGTSKEPHLRSVSPLLAAKKPDPWAHRYMHGDTSIQSASGVDQNDEEEYLHNIPPPLSPKRASYEPALGFGMPSRISQDLRASTSSRCGFSADPNASVSSVDLSSSRLTLPSAEPSSRRASQDYSAPIVKGSDGVLSKVCGSLVEPSESRNRWACADCASVFARDATLYAAPPSLQPQDSSYYCRDCYAKRYSLGGCGSCGRDVLGSTKEDGKYVKASSGIWHGRCWKCTSCSKGGSDGAEIFVGMDGKPTCESCFDRPRRASSAQPPKAPIKREETGLPDVRRLTRMGGTRNGPMGATIAELTKKLGQQSVSAAPRIPFSSRSNSNASLPKSAPLQSSLDAPRSPAKDQYAFPIHVPTSPGKAPSMTRSGSLTGSPPKPRRLTAQFRDGLNLAAFKPSFGADADEERLRRRDSRSRSVSPVKRPDWKLAVSPSKSRGALASSTSHPDDSAPHSDAHDSGSTAVQAEAKVPGSPSLPPVVAASNRLNVADQDPGRRRTSSGFLRPLNSLFSAPKKADHRDVLQGEKGDGTGSRDSSEGSLVSPLEPAEGTVRCATCHLLPFERPGSTETQEVVMVTLADQVHLHADCFRCSVCNELIDGAKTFVTLSNDAAYPALGEGLAAYAHPHCSPTIQLTTVRSHSEVQGSTGHGQKSYRTSLDPTSVVAMGRDGSRSHATHQRELKPSPVPSPAATMRGTKIDEPSRPVIVSYATSGGSLAVASSTSKVSIPSRPFQVSRSNTAPATTIARRFQPTAGAAPPVSRSPTLHTPSNPAAGIFSRMTALSTASNNPSLLTPSKFGGMPTCAYCGLKLSTLESVLGPRGTQWHKSCLVCRAPPPPPPKETLYGWRKQPPVMCGKKLDSGAKVNRDGEVRCRDCYDRESSAFRIKM